MCLSGVLLSEKKTEQTDVSADKYRSVLNGKMRPNSLIETFAVYLRVGSKV